MLTLYVLSAVLLLALTGFAALGVEDTRFHESWEPVRYQASPTVAMTWEDSLPGKKVLPWNESTATWIESEGK